MPRVEVEGLDISPEERFQRMVQLGEDGDYFNLARAYVDLRYRKMAGTATESELTTLDSFEDYITEAGIKDPEKGLFSPERSEEFLLGFFEQLNSYRSELAINCGFNFATTKDKISRGQVPGTRVYRGSEQAVNDLAGNMMSHSPEFMMMQSATFGMDMLVGAFDQEDLTEDMKRRMENISKVVQHYVDAAVPDSKIEETYHLTPQGAEFGLTDGADDLKPLYKQAEKVYEDGLRALDIYDHFRDTTTHIAKLQLQRMQEMAAKKKDNSPEFMEMMTALQDVANLDENDSPALADDRLQALQEASQRYADKIHGSFFSGRSADGRARMELAESLVEFAGLQSGTLRTAAKDKLEWDVSIDMQRDTLAFFSMSAALDPVKDTPLQQATIDEVRQGVATAGQTLDEPMQFATETIMPQAQHASIVSGPEPRHDAVVESLVQPIQESRVQQPKRAVLISYNDLESREQAAKAESDPGKNKPSKAQIEQAAQKRREESQPAKEQPVKEAPQGPGKK